MCKGIASSDPTLPPSRHSAASEPNPTHWEGEHHQALLSSEHMQETGEQAKTIKKEKILNHALTVHVQMAGWSQVCLEKPINTRLTITNTENKQWCRVIKQLRLSQAPAGTVQHNYFTVD